MLVRAGEGPTRLRENPAALRLAVLFEEEIGDLDFTAEWAGGELQIEPLEIEDAGWYKADDLPQLPSKISIARAMIDDFVRRRAFVEEDLETSESSPRKAQSFREPGIRLQASGFPWEGVSLLTTPVRRVMTQFL